MRSQSADQITAQCGPSSTMLRWEAVENMRNTDRHERKSLCIHSLVLCRSLTRPGVAKRCASTADHFDGKGAQGTGTRIHVFPFLAIPGSTSMDLDLEIIESVKVWHAIDLL